MLVVGQSSAHVNDTIDMNSKLDPKNSTWVKVCCSGISVLRLLYLLYFLNSLKILHLLLLVNVLQHCWWSFADLAFKLTSGKHGRIDTIEFVNVLNSIV